MTDTHEDDGRWGTVSEAAQALGVSVDTIRRRMKRGELETRREQTPQGFRWLIQLPDETLAGEASIQAPQNAPRLSQASDHGAMVSGPDYRNTLIETLQRELELRNQEIAHLHTVVESQARAIEQTAAALLTLPLSVPSEGKSAQVSPQARTAPLEVTHGSQHAIEGSVSTWERLYRFFIKR